jgi:hypothetical protein
MSWPRSLASPKTRSRSTRRGEGLSLDSVQHHVAWPQERGRQHRRAHGVAAGRNVHRERSPQGKPRLERASQMNSMSMLPRRPRYAARGFPGSRLCSLHIRWCYRASSTRRRRTGVPHRVGRSDPSHIARASSPTYSCLSVTRSTCCP